jgi:hypothetical protein
MERASWLWLYFVDTQGGCVNQSVCEHYNEECHEECVEEFYANIDAYDLLAASLHYMKNKMGIGHFNTKLMFRMDVKQHYQKQACRPPYDYPLQRPVYPLKFEYHSVTNKIEKPYTPLFPSSPSIDRRYKRYASNDIIKKTEEDYYTW